jgi:heat shock protein HslJ
VPTAEELDGHTFVATSVDGRELVAASELTLAFEDGRISAMAGCNTMNGSYTIDDGALEVGALAQTAMACEDALMDQDQWLASFLESSPTVALADSVLTLTGDDATITAEQSA